MKTMCGFHLEMKAKQSKAKCACYSAQTGSVAKLSLGAQCTPTVTLSWAPVFRIECPPNLTDSSALVLDAPPSGSFATRLSECLYACDSAHMDSVAGLRLGAHQLSTTRLCMRGRLCLGSTVHPNRLTG
jgi:hypothetical protein